jgi:hypothetical protein
MPPNIKTANDIVTKISTIPERNEKFGADGISEESIISTRTRKRNYAP